MENQESRAEIILGVDTHLEIHVGVVIDAAGRVLGTLSVGTHNHGYKQLLCWAQTFGLLRRAGVEGTGSYGAALTRVLQTNGVKVIEINRPDRSRRRGRGKSDATDAECAARAVLAGDAMSIPKLHSRPCKIPFSKSTLCGVRKNQFFDDHGSDPIVHTRNPHARSRIV